MQSSFRQFTVCVVGLVVGCVLGGPAATASAQSRQVVPAGEAADASSQAVGESVPESAFNPEYCEILERWNADKKIADEATRRRFAGEYGQADDSDRLKTWNVETACGEFLVAVPLWADVSPPVLARIGDNLFEDSMLATWDFQVGGDGAVTGVVMISADGVASTMTRLGDSRHWGDPHENLNGKHAKDWDTKKK